MLKMRRRCIKNIVVMVLVFWIILKMGAENSSETVVSSDNATRYHSTNDPSLNTHRRGNFCCIAPTLHFEDTWNKRGETFTYFNCKLEMGGHP
jgi:hypothetical protein